jgi:hypothetical protein
MGVFALLIQTVPREACRHGLMRQDHSRQRTHPNPTLPHRGEGLNLEGEAASKAKFLPRRGWNFDWRVALKRCCAERITVVRVAAGIAALEPAHALGGAAVGEGVGNDAAAGLGLQLVVADG